jgi:hypothetical protein
VNSDAIVTVNVPIVTADPKSVCIGSTVYLQAPQQMGAQDHVTGSTFDAAGLTASLYRNLYIYGESVVRILLMLVTVNALPIVTADLKVFVVQFYLQAPADGV